MSIFDLVQVPASGAAYTRIPEGVGGACALPPLAVQRQDGYSVVTLVTTLQERLVFLIFYKISFILLNINELLFH